MNCGELCGTVAVQTGLVVNLVDSVNKESAPIPVDPERGRYAYKPLYYHTASMLAKNTTIRQKRTTVYAAPAKNAATVWFACRSRLCLARSYLAVMRGSEWRAAIWTSRSGTPASRQAVT